MVRRIVALWLIMIALCIAAIALGRTDHRPNALDKLGFTMCGDKPCYRGVTMGMDWATAKALLPDAREDDGALSLALEGTTADTKTYRFITIGTYPVVSSIEYTNSSEAPPQITVAQLIQQFGIPCRVALNQIDAPEFILLFPHLTASVISTEVVDHRLQFTSKIWNMYIDDDP